MSAPAAERTFPPCPFCDEPLKLRRCLGGHWLKCPKCVRDVCYDMAPKLRAFACRKPEPETTASPCRACKGKLTQGCPQRRSYHLWCLECGTCWSDHGNRLKCEALVIACSHCKGSGVEPPRAPPKPRSN